MDHLNLGWFKMIKVYFATILEARRGKLGCLEGNILFLKTLSMFDATVLVSGVARNPWHSLVCRHVIPLSVSVITWYFLCVCLSVFASSPLLIRTQSY
jgi:hypothetical protein